MGCSVFIDDDDDECCNAVDNISWQHTQEDAVQIGHLVCPILQQWNVVDVWLNLALLGFYYARVING